MHRFPRSFLGLGVLTLAACGAPAELDENRFPGPDQTGYTDGPTGPNPPVGNGGAPNAGNGGTSNVGAGGTASGAGPGAPVGAGSGPGAPVGAGGSDMPTNPAPTVPPAASGCPDDITVLFNRPLTEGGCATAGCHVPGATPPDLVSPGLEDRLLNVTGTSSCGQRPYISSGESLLSLKLVGDPVPCGFRMPLGAVMPEEDLQCVLDWIAQVSGG